MNETNNYSGDENLSFRQIVLSYMRKIMDLNLRVIPQENIIDYTKCYKRAVLGLSDVLLPFFDNEMSCAYERFLEDYDLMMRETTNGQVIKDISGYSSKSMNVCRMIFSGVFSLGKNKIQQQTKGRTYVIIVWENDYF
jgi:hypothetical protein